MHFAFLIIKLLRDSIGIICPPLPSHIGCMAALGRELQQRNHRVTFLGIADIESQVEAEGLHFWQIGQSDHPPGSVSQFRSQMGKMSGLSAMRFAFRTVQLANEMICRDAPGALQEAGVELLLVDQGEPMGGTVAEFLDIPFISICCGLPINREASIPPYFTPWQYHNSWWARSRNQFGYAIFDTLSRSIAKQITQKRQQWKLPAYRHPDDAFSQLAQISQIPAEFDFPHRALPKCFHYTGSFRKSSTRSVPFPYEQLTNQPLIYASMGTIQNRQQEIFDSIAAACEKLDAQLVISLGGGECVEDYQGLSRNPLIVKYAPQMELLAKASLMITHAGLNTILECLGHGVPMVAIPITGDQLGVGARLSWTGAGEVVPLSRLSVPRLREAVQQVWAEDSYRQNAAKLRESIHQAGGVVRAADLVEQVIATGKPVLASRTQIPQQ